MRERQKIEIESSRMENVFKIVYLIGLIGASIGEVAVNQSPSFDWGAYSIEHKPAAEYGPPPADPALEYGAPLSISSESFEIARGNLELAEHVIEVNTPSNRPTFTHHSPSIQFEQLKKPTVSFSLAIFIGFDHFKKKHQFKITKIFSHQQRFFCQKRIHRFHSIRRH